MTRVYMVLEAFRLIVTLIISERPQFIFNIKYLIDKPNLSIA